MICLGWGEKKKKLYQTEGGVGSKTRLEVILLINKSHFSTLRYSIIVLEVSLGFGNHLTLFILRMDYDRNGAEAI